MTHRGVSFIVIPFIANIIIRIISASLRLKFYNLDQTFQFWQRHRPCIFAFWHNNLFIMPYVYQKVFRDKICALTSLSKDGEYITRCLRYFGIDSVRGSSSRGGKRAFKEVVERVRAGYDVAITPDGPKGPRYQIQMGVIKLAEITGIPIIPVKYIPDLRVELDTWDKFIIPVPFSKVDFIFEEPIFVEKGCEDTKYSETLKIRLNS